MSESKGISLRRKKTTAARPIISGPIQQTPRDPSADRNNSTYSSLADAKSTRSDATSRERPRLGGDQTSDLVKRRYSTRFTTGVPQDGPTPPMPAMPSLPSQYRSDAASQRSRSRPGPVGTGPSAPASGMNSPDKDGERGPSKLKIDMRALKDPNLQAEKYVQAILADATAADIEAYQRDLQGFKAHTDADLQHNVFQNRTQFIKISKEADKLKTEMRTLRTLMSDLTSALGHAASAGGADLNTAASTLSLADRKRANRSSVANLEAMWSTHLQTLWKRVEGSQKYLPALPGRHIIMESQRWVELNAATWKPRRRVALVLLNDHLLIASEKKRPAEAAPQKNNRQSMYGGPQSSTQTMLVADRCWPLHDVSLADISTRASTAIGHSHSKENKAIADAINVRAGNESFTYATADSGDKLSLIVAFRKAQEDQRKLLAQEHNKREKELDQLGYLSARDPRSLKKAAAAGQETSDANPFSTLSRSNSVLVDVDGRPQSIRWVESQIDGLDIDIALQHFEGAVSRVEKLRKMARGIKGNQTAQDIIQAKVNERASKLASVVARQLGYESGGQEATQRSVSWLLRLGFEELARTTYLGARTDTIRIRTRSLPFTGALEPYVKALSFTTFALLLHTFRTFNVSFPSTSGSAVVKWAKERVDEFNSTLAKQMSSIEKDGQLWNACVSIVRKNAQVLREVGVDFHGIVARGLEGGGMKERLADAGPGVGLGVTT